MNFEQWLAAQDLDVATLTVGQLKALKAAFEAGGAARADGALEMLRLALPGAPVQAPAPAPATAPANATPALDLQAHATQLERCNAISRLSAEFGPLQADVNGARVDIAAHAVREGWDADRTRQAFQLEQLRGRRANGPNVIVRDHDRDCSLQALQAAMILRANGRLDHGSYQSRSAVAMRFPDWLRADVNAETRQRAMEWGHRFSGLSAVDLCREAVRLDGRDAGGMDRDTLIQTGFSGGSLTSIFTTSINAVLLATYMDSPDTTAGWTREEDVNDFKTNERISLAKGATLTKLPRGGEADDANRSDRKETYRIGRYANKFTVDEQDMIDDNLGAIADMPVEMGQAARRLRPDLVYAILLANPTLNVTGVALCSDSNPQDNLLGSNALSAAAIKAAVAAQMLFQDNGVNLNLKPTHMIVPATLMHLGRELAQSATIIIAGTAGSVTERGTQNSIVADGLSVVAEGRIENGLTDPDSGTVYSGSSSTWWLVSNLAKTIIIGYLRGTGRAPQVRSFVLDKGKWGIGWDIKMDIGAKALDWRGFVKNTQ